MKRVEAIRVGVTVACVRSAQPCASFSSPSTIDSAMSRKVYTSLIGSLAMSSRDLRLYTLSRVIAGADSRGC